MTGKVVVNRAMSLDGFVAGPDDAVDWVFDHATPDQYPDVMHATGAMLCGRRTYDVGQRDAVAGKASGDAYGGLWSGPVFVLTHRPPPGARGPSGLSGLSGPSGPSDGQHTFLSGDITAAVGTAKAAAGDKDLEILGSDVTAQCLRHGLVDEIFVLLLPVLLGRGVPFLTGPDVGQARLELASNEQFGAVTALRFRVAATCAS